MNEIPLDTGDQKQVKKRKTKAQIKRQQEQEWLKYILSTVGGRDFLWRLLTECGIYHASFTGEAPTTFFNEGKRHIGLWSLDEIFKADLGAYALMMKENEETE